MKQILPLTFLLVCSLVLCAQEPTLAWAKQIGTTTDNNGNSVVVDKAGNVYTTGYFHGTVDFDPGPNVYNLTATGYSNIFVSKLDAAGNFLWAKQFGADNNNTGFSIAVDGAGNVFTTGRFEGTADFDPGPGIYNLVSIGYPGIFILKLDPAGNFVWAKQLGNASGISYSVATDELGNVYTTGYFAGTADFDPGPGVYNLTPLISFAIFVSKLDTDGNFVWARKFDTIEGRGQSVAVDAAGNVYTTGSFEGTTDFDPGPGTYNLTSLPNLGVFISKLDAAGNFVWAKQFYGLYNIGLSVTTDALGNVYTTGTFKGKADFDPGPNIYNLTSTGESINTFISKLNAAGKFIWAKQLSGTTFSVGTSVTVDGKGNVYTTGYFGGTTDFDPGPGIFNLEAPVGDNAFVSKLDSTGNFVWAKQLGGSGYNHGQAVTLDTIGNLYMTGQFQSTVDFDPGPNVFNLTVPKGASAVYVVKWSQSPVCTPPTFLNDMTIVLDASKCGNDGNISIIPNSGKAPFMYSVDGGAAYVSGPDKGYTFQGLDAGTYQLRLKDAGGCESAVVTKEVKTVYECATCTSPTFLNNRSIVLDASCNGNDGNVSIIPTSGTAPFMYSIDGGVTYVAGPDGGYTFMGLAAGTYQLRLKAGNGCQSAVVTREVKANAYGSCATLSFVGPRLHSLTDNSTAFVRTYPNPSGGQFKVQLQGFASAKVQVQILDSKGSVLQTRTLNASEGNVLDINLRGKAKGLYFVRVISDKGVQVQKVTVQ